jgi:hypothetical protein
MDEKRRGFLKGLIAGAASLFIPKAKPLAREGWYGYARFGIPGPIRTLYGPTADGVYLIPGVKEIPTEMFVGDTITFPVHSYIDGRLVLTPEGLQPGIYRTKLIDGKTTYIPTDLNRNVVSPNCPNPQLENCYQY